MIGKVNLIGHQTCNIGKIRRCILMKPYHGSKLIHTLEVCHYNTIQRFGSKINCYRISHFCPRQF